jgi:hypothetical protein
MLGSIVGIAMKRRVFIPLISSAVLRWLFPIQSHASPTATACIAMCLFMAGQAHRDCRDDGLIVGLFLHV